MATEIILIKEGNMVIPATEHDAELWRNVSNRAVTVIVKQTRNLGHHRWWWTLVEKVRSAKAPHKTRGQVNDDLKIMAGFAVVAESLDGKTRAYPESISFGSMGQDRFRSFTRATGMVAANLLGVDPETLGVEIDRDYERCANPECGRPAEHTHHIFQGTAGRERSDRLGYVVRICHVCHEDSHAERDGDPWGQLWCKVLGIDYQMARMNVYGKGYKLRETVK